MAQLFNILLIIAVLFGSAEAAVDSIHLDDGHKSGSHIVHDHNDLDSDVDHEEDNCNRYCHCTHYIGTLFPKTSTIFHTYSLETGSNDYNYRYQPLLSLYRPPIN